MRRRNPCWRPRPGALRRPKNRPVSPRHPLATAAAQDRGRPRSQGCGGPVVRLRRHRSASGKASWSRFWRDARTHALHDPERWKVHHLGRWALASQPPPSHTLAVAVPNPTAAAARHHNVRCRPAAVGFVPVNWPAMSIPSKVLLLCWRDTGHPQGGGSERYLERVGTELASRGRVTLLTARYPGSGQQEYRDGLRIIRRWQARGVPSALAIIAAGRLGMGPLAGFDPDLVVDTQNGCRSSRRPSAAPHRRAGAPLSSRAVAGRRTAPRACRLVHRVAALALECTAATRYVTVSRPSARNWPNWAWTPNGSP